VIHAPRLAGKFATNFFSTRQFFEDAEEGELPTYSFIEPQIIGWNHNDMHPPFAGMLGLLAEKVGAPDAAGVTFDPPSSLIAGEDLLARIYDAIRRSASPTGSNHLNTTLLVTFDEHGGTYDHVPPPAAVPPNGNGQPGQMGFTFNRSGVRIPTLAISAWIPEGTVINHEYRATSLLATMRERFNLGARTQGTANVAKAWGCHTGLR
jgi:phospholipase C